MREKSGRGGHDLICDVTYVTTLRHMRSPIFSGTQKLKLLRTPSGATSWQVFTFHFPPLLPADLLRQQG
jgi:hypothetical protein